MSLPEEQSSQRSVLYIRTHQDTEPFEHYGLFQDWDFKAVTGLLNVMQTEQEQPASVGLIHIEKVDIHDLRALEKLLTEHRETEWVILTTTECLETKAFCKLIRDACYDYFTLPLGATGTQALQATLGHAHGMASLHVDDARSSQQDYEMVGSSAPMMLLFESIRKVACVDAPVLITGESGTGKELIAQAIHERSSRAAGPFIAVNCGAIPEQLINSELFGHEKGAFTGAHQCKVGQIEAASGGTLFLDEVGDLPLEQQVNLLRFLQEQVIQRVGSNQLIPVDVRVLAATHVDLETAREKGGFREDLLYRLNVLHIETPALRERDGDIEILARYFFERFRQDGGRRLRGFSSAALLALEQHSWPGNVRELINRIRRAIVMCEGRLIGPDDLGLNVVEFYGGGRVRSLEDARIDAEKEAIVSALRSCKQNMTRAAKVLGVSRVTLYRLVEKHQLQKMLN